MLSFTEILQCCLPTHTISTALLLLPDQYAKTKEYCKRSKTAPVPLHTNIRTARLPGSRDALDFSAVVRPQEYIAVNDVNDSTLPSVSYMVFNIPALTQPQPHPNHINHCMYSIRMVTYCRKWRVRHRAGPASFCLVPSPYIVDVKSGNKVRGLEAQR